MSITSNQASIESTRIWLEHNGYDVDKMDIVDVERATYQFGEWFFNLYNPRPLEHIRFWIDTAINGEVTTYEPK